MTSSRDSTSLSRWFGLLLRGGLIAAPCLSPAALAQAKGAEKDQAVKDNAPSGRSGNSASGGEPLKKEWTADEVLLKADEIRNPSSSYKMEVSVESTTDPTFRFEINIGGKDASLIRTLDPAREVGKNYLMLNENMWAYIPNIKRAIRVTLNQKLTGQAANGDISRMRWYGDYEAKMESDDQDQWTLFLTAQHPGLTYDKIRVVIDKKTFRPKHGEYLTTQGKLLKKIEFVEYGVMAGALRPTKMVLTNATKASEQSTLRILKMADETFPSGFFNESNLQ